MVRRADIIVSVCPPHAALDIARQVAGFGGVYVDANAISPATAREVAGLVEAGGASYVDGGIIGTPPVTPGSSGSTCPAREPGRSAICSTAAGDARVVDHGGLRGSVAWRRRR